MAEQKKTVEATVRNIRWATRKKYTAEEKVRIVVKGLWGKSKTLLRKISPFLISFLITLIVTLVIIEAREDHPIEGANAIRLPGECRLLILSPELQFVTTYVFECAGKFSTRIWPLPIENPWNEEWYKDEEWYKNWKYRERPQQARLFYSMKGEFQNTNLIL